MRIPNNNQFFIVICIAIVLFTTAYFKFRTTKLINDVRLIRAFTIVNQNDSMYFLKKIGDTSTIYFYPKVHKNGDTIFLNINKLKK